ncbi:hypothetical protein CJF30_00002403 [Rutstroemia sp. NJR-2017a BBW]|nr:hypothetical protein CJF30_00002403 [Rutstroemia sp. NJR-2017a BBW]
MRSPPNRVLSFLLLTFFLILSLSHTTALPTTSTNNNHPPPTHSISPALFASLEELARIVDIAYCVGVAGTGIQKPFQCASRCKDFPGFELVTSWHTGVLMGDGCGFLVVDHGRGAVEGEGGLKEEYGGTYSIANTIVDLSTIPQEYVPYPEDPDKDPETLNIPPSSQTSSLKNLLPWPFNRKPTSPNPSSKSTHPKKCTNCTVHSGFLSSWKNTRPYLLPHLTVLKHEYPNYELHLVGHSLGGAVAALAGLELLGRGWRPVVTTFGEPQVGNEALRGFLDGGFGLDGEERGEGYGVGEERRYRRVTHMDDPVPLLPLREWGYRSHAGEVYIGKAELQPGVGDLRLCFGDEDGECIAGGEEGEDGAAAFVADVNGNGAGASKSYGDKGRDEEMEKQLLELQWRNKKWGLPIPARYKLWQLFFAHRDYFWRLGLCLPGGDPWDWNRPRYNISDDGMRMGERGGGGEGEMEGEREEL